MFRLFEKNKENLPYSSDKQIDTNDCFINELERNSSDINCKLSSSMMGILPVNLSRGTNLYLFYESKIVNVRLVESVSNLEHEQRLTISHQNSFYSIPKRHLYLSNYCPLIHRTRIAFISSRLSKYLVGFICELPSKLNNFRYLILFDDGTTCYTQDTDEIYLCLNQNFRDNLRFIESKSIRDDCEYILFSTKQISFTIDQYIQVKKFDDKYHNAQIIELDCSIIKIKFYERQAQTQIWIHKQSNLINDQCLVPIDIASPVIFPKRKRIESIRNENQLNIHFDYPIDQYLFHECSSNCVRLVEQYFDLNFITQNPYTLPFSCGWKYFHIERLASGRFRKKPTTHKMNFTRSSYLYRSPCGRSFLTLNEIEDYLYRTNSKLSIKFFVNDLSTEMQPLLTFPSQYILQDDLTQGKEHVKIPVFNNINTELPERFVYGVETRSNLKFINDTTTITCCSCPDNCRNRMKCPCWLKTFYQAKLTDNEQIINWKRMNLSDEQMIERFGYVHQRLKTTIWSGIYECHSQCSCHVNHCTNRLVQNSLFQQLQLFYTENKGWGLRVLHDIPSGSFINAYVGELITEEMAMKRDFKYLAMLDHKSMFGTMGKKKRQQVYTQHVKLIMNEKENITTKRYVRLSTDSLADDDDAGEDDEMISKSPNHEDSCFILDAKHYGSISRFYNHSCKPNVHIQNVFINSQDPRFPVIALFACRTIRAGEELCWDYNYTVGCMPDVHIECQCQAPNCRGRLL